MRAARQEQLGKSDTHEELEDVFEAGTTRSGDVKSASPYDPLKHAPRRPRSRMGTKQTLKLPSPANFDRNSMEVICN